MVTRPSVRVVVARQQRLKATIFPGLNAPTLAAIKRRRQGAGETHKWVSINRNLFAVALPCEDSPSIFCYRLFRQHSRRPNKIRVRQTYSGILMRQVIDDQVSETPVVFAWSSGFTILQSHAHHDARAKPFRLILLFHILAVTIRIRSNLPPADGKDADVVFCHVWYQVDRPGRKVQQSDLGFIPSPSLICLLIVFRPEADSCRQTKRGGF
ncbi:uncharacterized protein LY79DRAFT_47445 [Colletotrichum navitas]|uniref:Uncharacterized protein n=1 Tax=Colletotrichum navitas TaxID=681940 RepID=A0AAD8Q8H6_9PEZI|nr:uncharacterized protein LY79DRAFT_47445 [Colletotrichum navitas]KAK1596519.1 hypothetical protein LY79DRAFT_47445 [Colletotrichum navitas]